MATKNKLDKECLKVKDPIEEKRIFGMVVNCDKLNIRVSPNENSEIVTVVDRGIYLEIDNKNSTKDFYKVYTESGIEGFCMKEYIFIE